MSSRDRTRDWYLYEEGKRFNNSLEPNYYDLVECNWDFFTGNQWRNVNVKNMPKPTFNLVKRAVSFQVASLISAKTRIHFEPLDHSITPDMGIPPEMIANAAIENLLEKFKFDFRLKDIATDGAVTGDGCIHFYWDQTKKPFGNAFSDVRGEVCMETVDGTHIYFGNPNVAEVEEQPYIIVQGRAMVEDLKAEAKLYRQGGQPEELDGDSTTDTTAGEYGKIEIDADGNKKATYLIVYRKKKIKKERVDPLTGVAVVEEVTTIIASKSTEKAYIFKDIDLGLSCYPIAWFNWEPQKNCYHGRALCTGMIPNQIFVNRAFAMAFYHLQMTAFPRAIFNQDIIDTWSNEIGVAIPVSGVPLETNLKNVAGYLEPGNMSSQITQIIEMATSFTQESLGINDNFTGNVDPKNTSAIIATQKQASVPLQNTRSQLYEFVENTGKILFDFIGTHYGLRPIVLDVDGVKSVVQYDFSQFKNLWLNVRVDVGESSYWSEIATNQTLTNLLTQGSINIIQFLERTSTEYVPQKEKLIQELKMQQEQMMMEQQAMMEQQGPPPGNPPM